MYKKDMYKVKRTLDLESEAENYNPSCTAIVVKTDRIEYHLVTGIIQSLLIHYYY